ncbi:MAG: Rrf2 family transcriptional regulator [Nitrospira sp.]|nr:Rrf2 family transcriptional regulator [Nitrospira sp.]HBP88194.1 transcriptional regulator [Nitrospiraceae bacterium]HNP30063.1 Rrf2 family transcriptional regulator [Nitrospirales bacterium]
MNKFPLKVTYGIMATIELAKQDRSIPLQAKVIAKRQGIPSRFIEQILQHLKQAGIVRSLRGAQGGYTLAQHPSQISLADLVNSMNGWATEPLNQNGSANGFPESREIPNALLSSIWQQVQEAEQAVLRAISIQKLVEQYQTLETQHCVMYHI